LSIKKIDAWKEKYPNSVKMFLIYLISLLASTAATYSASVLDNMTKSFDDPPPHIIVM